MQQFQSHSGENKFVGASTGMPGWLERGTEDRLPDGLERPKTILRCGACNLVQFETRSGCCRRCDHLLPLLQERAAKVCAGQQEEPQTHFNAEASGPDRKSRREWSTGLRRAVARQTRERRMALGISQVKLARILGIPRSYLSRVENEHLLPGPAMLARFAQHLGIEFSSIWKGADCVESGDTITADIQAVAGNLPLEMLALVVRRTRQMAAGGSPLSLHLRQVA